MLMVKNTFNIEMTYVVPATYVTENKEDNYLEIYIFQVSCLLSLPLLNIQNCQSVLKFLSLCCKLFMYDSFISKLESMNYLSANLVVAWL